MENRPGILVVEDDDLIRETLVECLDAEGYATAAAANGAEALQRLGGARLPDLVLVDLVMPIMNGTEMLERLRADPATRHVPVVLMTAVAAREAEPLPAADEVLRKPFELDAVLGAVARCLGRRRPPRGGKG